MYHNVITLFTQPIKDKRQFTIIVLSSLLFIFMPQLPPSDWKLNTVGLFENLFGVYQNPNYVYPPWALIPLCLYRLIGSEGTRILSVITIGLLCNQQQWSLINYFTIILSPYFLATMTKSNIDIISYVLPVILMNSSRQSPRFQFIKQLIAVYLLLIKPQGALFLLPYLFVLNDIPLRRVLELGLTIMLLTIPISLVGDPPLGIQWINNITHPSPQNEFYWSINNISITSKTYILQGIIVVIIISLLILCLVKRNVILWSSSHWVSSLLFLSMLLSPYTSQQSLSSSLAFVPSVFAFVYQLLLILFISYRSLYFDYLPFIVISVFLISIITFKYPKSPDETTI
ncbi:MAG: hypothetical protein KatS3mg046_717 [Bellilinea sp.]|nr:MAG: hypothetical protein KatS3mg046_717 [Bellilinea sp.]